jgi:hypothetical protein
MFGNDINSLHNSAALIRNDFQYFSSLGSVIACQHFHSVAFPDVQFLLLV